MTTAYRCDSCGKFFDEEPSLIVQYFMPKLEQKNPDISTFQQVDLCEKCSSSIEKTLNNISITIPRH